jgi:hypothetical protein
VLAAVAALCRQVSRAVKHVNVHARQKSYLVLVNILLPDLLLLEAAAFAAFDVQQIF